MLCAVAGELDLRRLRELAHDLGGELSEVVGALVDELDTALAQIDAALSLGDLDGVSRAAHAARNSALMIDARRLLEELDVVETAARGGDHGAARDGRDRLRARWPALRARLDRAGRGDR